MLQLHVLVHLISKLPGCHLIVATKDTVAYIPSWCIFGPRYLYKSRFASGDIEYQVDKTWAGIGL